MSWPDGYNEKLGQNAGRLSKGERQRLGMARLIFKRPIPKVLILDEFNSHLDPSGDETVWSALDQHLFVFPNCRL
jgi:ABC-type protease/lipase transport system fused ATPase/permease subunit